MKIAIDLDEILCEFLEGLIKYYNQRFKTSYKKEDFFSYNFWEVWGGDVERAKKIAQDFYDSDMMDEVLPVDGAIEGFKKISQNNKKIYIITSRHFSWRSKTEKWLAKYLDGYVKEIIFTSDFYKEAKNKDEVCKEKNIKLIIEDNFDYARECANKGIKVILLDKPWNQKLARQENITRVNSWQEILAQIN